MKKLSILVFILLIISSFACKNSKKKSSGSSSNSLSVSCDADLQTLNGSSSISDSLADCSGSTCYFKKSGAYSKSYKIKVKFDLSGNYKGNNIRSWTTDSNADLSNGSNTSYFTLTGTSPSKGNSKSVTVCVRDVDKCKDAGDSSCTSESSSCSSSYEDSCTIYLDSGDSSSSSSSDSSSSSTLKALWISLGCNLLGTVLASDDSSTNTSIAEQCNQIKDTLISLGVFDEDDDDDDD